MSNWEKTLIPNVGPHHWVPFSAQELIKASNNDTTSRPIAVKFFLEDPRARTQHVYVTLDKEKSFHSGDGTESINVWLEHNEKGFLQSILVGVNDTKTEYAFQRAAGRIYPILSLWAYQYKRPFSIQEIKLIDKKHNAVWIIPKFCPESLKLEVSYLSFGEDCPIGTLFALFREGMNSTSSAYRFLSYFKIAEAWKNKKGPFDWLIKAAIHKGIDPNFPIRKVTKDLLGGSYKASYHNDYINRKFTWCVDRLDEVRAVIAHPFNKLSQYANLDSPDVQAEIGALANLTERIAIQLLEDFLCVYTFLTF